MSCPVEHRPPNLSEVSGSPDQLRPGQQQPDRRSFWIEWLLVTCCFAIFATVRSPIPGVNEPHYLTKAKHFWDSTWCQRDPFLQSVNAHYVFYVVVGWLTLFLPLEITAWLGRIAGWLTLGAGWTRLCRSLIPQPSGATLAACVLLLFSAIGNWSGEWAVGGIESKVFSYGLAWLGLSSALEGRFTAAALWNGAAVAFHPVVGIWSTLATIFAVITGSGNVGSAIRNMISVTTLRLVACWLAASAAGLLPALLMVSGADPQLGYQADYIQVFHRLAHHLDPMRFSNRANLCYVGLLVTCIVLYLRVPRSGRWAVAARYVFAAVLIALAGVLVRTLPAIAEWLATWPVGQELQELLQEIGASRPRLAKWLKFYPFRLADLTLPCACALLVTREWLGFWFAARPSIAPVNQGGSEVAEAKTPVVLPRWKRQVLLTALPMFILLTSSLMLPAVDRNPSRLSPAQLAGWQDACHFVRENTPPDALCYSVNEGWALRWYAHRADYLSHKDCPQDAAGIVAWNERFKTIGTWSKRCSPGGYSAADLSYLRRLTGIDYLIVRRFGPIHLRPVYRNAVYQVYQLPK